MLSEIDNAFTICYIRSRENPAFQAVQIKILRKPGYQLEVVICIGSSCHLKGSRDIVKILERLVAMHNLGKKVELKGSFCMGECTSGVCVKVDGKLFSVTPAGTEEFFNENILKKLQV